MEAPASFEPGTGVRVTYLGNSTVLISDGINSLMVDGFLSRPGKWQTIFGKVKPDQCVIAKQLHLTGITRLDALLVGHSHHDHALDAPTVADLTGADVLGSMSLLHVFEGHYRDTWDQAKREDWVRTKFIVVPPGGLKRDYGKFRVTLSLSEHVPPHLIGQSSAQGQITKKVPRSARATDYKHGDVFVIHVAHPEGSVAITTTASAREGQFDEVEGADVVMLATGLLAKEPEESQEFYWSQTVGKLEPKVVIPIHWDDFTRPLDEELPPEENLAASSLLLLDDTRKAMDFVKTKAPGEKSWVMGLRDSFLLRDRQIERAPRYPVTTPRSAPDCAEK